MHTLRFFSTVKAIVLESPIPNRGLCTTTMLTINFLPSTIYGPSYVIILHLKFLSLTASGTVLS